MFENHFIAMPIGLAKQSLSHLHTYTPFPPSSRAVQGMASTRFPGLVLFGYRIFHSSLYCAVVSSEYTQDSEYVRFVR